MDFKVAIWIAGFALMTQACVNSGYNSRKLGLKDDFLQPGNGPNLGLLSSYNCPEEENIIPAFDEHLTGQQFYVGCTHKNNLESVLLDGEPYYTSEICIYPIEVLGPNNIVVKPHPTEGGIWRECKFPNEEGYYTATFPGTSMNAVIVVENYALFQNQMDECLVAQNFNLCPEFSSGRTR